MFNEFLRSRNKDISSVSDEDYLNFIDGKPRYEGVKSFLASRGISLAYGNPGDKAGKGTVCGLGNMKNEIFKDLIEKEGVELYDDALNQLKQWRRNGLNTAVVSSSKNCKYILEHLNLLDSSLGEPYFTQQLPSVFSDDFKFDDICQGKEPFLFFDYDGTLTKIVKNPEDAVLSDDVKTLLKEVSRKYHMAIITGRDLDDIKNMVKLDNIIYAGSHGFRISGPGIQMEHEKTKEILPELDDIEQKLTRLPDSIEGLRIERKRYAIAVHYRNTPENYIPEVFGKVEHILEEHPILKKGEGKKIIEIKPSVDWNKGKALMWILENLQLADSDHIIPIYIGDDTTDEDAFNAIADYGVGILVGSHSKPSSAKYMVKDVSQVKAFLQKLID